MVCQFESRRIELRDNLLTVYASASPQARLDGLTWYPKARQTIRAWSRSYGLSRSAIACIVASLSPQISWSKNVDAAKTILEGGLPNQPLQVNVRKARELYEIAREKGKTYNAHADMFRLFPCGPKVNSFAYNLAGNDSVVTVDGHAIQAALNDVYSTITVKWTPYKVFAEVYAETARTVELTPATFQAIVWCAWKEKYPTEYKKKVRRVWSN